MAFGLALSPSAEARPCCRCARLLPRLLPGRSHRRASARAAQSLDFPPARTRNMSDNHLKFYINGAWVDPVKPATIDVINPATEEAFTKIAAGAAADVDKAVAAARAAFPAFSQTSKAERVALLKRIIAVYEKRIEDIAQAVSAEMGA